MSVIVENNNVKLSGRPPRFTKEFIENEAVEFLKWTQLPDSVYFKEFALKRGYSPKQFSEWSESNEIFREAYHRVREWQETRIAKGALVNEFNSNFSKFFMSNVCAWADRQETKITGDHANPLSFVIDSDNRSKDLIPMVEEQQIEYTVNDGEE